MHKSELQLRIYIKSLKIIERFILKENKKTMK